MAIQSRSASKDIVLRSKTLPYPAADFKTHDVNVSWLFRNMDSNVEKMEFAVDRSKKDCFTPRRNTDVYAAERFFAEFQAWSVKVCNYFVHFLQVQSRHTEHYKVDVSAINANDVFVPVLPLFLQKDEAPGEQDISQVVPTASSSSIISSEKTVSLPVSITTRLQSEQERSLWDRLARMDSLFADTSTVNVLFTAAEAKIVVICCHIANISQHLSEGISFIEDMIRKQLIAAVGKELQPSDFAAYMQFHNRKLFKPEYQATPFTHSVRRSVTHSPEGMLRIDANSESIYTVAQHSPASEHNKMEFTLNAATKVRFGGDRHVHGWLAHSFSHQSLPQLSLVAQARQFSSFIVLVGRIASATLFEPKYGFIVQNKDEVTIPLLLEQIPTPKEFRDAIESLSPEQQRFAKAFRSMQLESTLFGVCVIQIKPQLEKVLKLSRTSWLIASKT
eukprot:gene24500-30852_t